MAYAGLPLLYVAFNTFAPVHDAILHRTGLGWRRRTSFAPGPHRLDRHPRCDGRCHLGVAQAVLGGAEHTNARLALLAATAAALASVASSYDSNWGVDHVGRTEYGALVADTSLGSYGSLDGGLTWTKTSEYFVPLEIRQFMELGEKEPSGIFSKGDIRITAHEVLISGEMVYSFKHLQNPGNKWMQALDKRDVHSRVVATRPRDFFYDSQSGNLILAMGLQGIVVVAPDGKTTQIAVGRFSPTDFSFGSKVRTFFSSLLHGEVVESAGLAFLLAFSFASLALGLSAASGMAKDLRSSCCGNLGISRNHRRSLPPRNRGRF